ncbi:MAG TPA: hypothetical protein VN726_04520 [Hanamia sp.]|nr:hypothetical protein [Hanamia sp.]
MKNLFIFIIFIIVFVLIFIRTASAQSVDDIIDQYLVARGGLDKLQSIQSIELEGIRQMMNGEVNVKITKVQGKLFRSDFSFGEIKGYTIITPLGGWACAPSDPGKVQQLPWSNVAPALQELDIAGPLVDYKSKGYAATLLGRETVEGRDCYQIQLSRESKIHSIYFLDVKTKFLVQSRVISVSDDESYDIITSFSDYAEFEGVLFPQKISVAGGVMSEGSIIFHRIQVNVPVHQQLFLPL